MKFLTLLAALAMGLVAFSQDSPDPNIFVIKCSEFGVTPALRNIDPVLPDWNGIVKEINPIRYRRALNDRRGDAPLDPVVQATGGSREAVDILQNFTGTLNNEAGGYLPPDPSGAVGPNHYIEMVNTAMEIFDLEGNSVWGPTMLNQIFPNAGNSGDPIVLYDEQADVWFISQFQFDNSIRIGISQTPDPTGEWYWYSFQFPSFPDYPKYSVWTDGYYVSSNMGGTNSAAFEREKMIAGDPSAQAVLIQLPQQGTNGFRTALPVDIEGMDDPGRPAMIINVNDDAWGSQDDDHLRIWEFDVDWDTPANSSLEILTTIPVSSFDGVPPGFGFSNVDQPGNANSLDAILDGLMFPAKFRAFPTHQSMVVCHGVEIDNTGKIGMRWYELRDGGQGAGWTLYQEGTYSPDDDSRWMGSIGIDAANNISMAYSVSSENVYPGLRFTGRYASDPLGEMTVDECVIIEGTGTQGANRWGDYAQMTVDPVQGFDFWFVGEFTRNSGGAWGTQIASWRLQSPSAIDLGTISLLSPVTGPLTATEAISAEVRNFGAETQTDFDVSYQINGGGIITEQFVGSLVSGQVGVMAFAATADMSAYGDYEITVFTSIPDDGWEMNDVYTTVVTHLFPQDIGVVGLISPVTDQFLTDNETVTVVVENFGTIDIATFDIQYVVNGGAPVVETVEDVLVAGATAEYTFATGVDMLAVGDYAFGVCTLLESDGNADNDCYSEVVTNVEPFYCSGSADCASFNDAILRVRFNTIDNESECSENAYADYTGISTTVNLNGEYVFGATVGYPDHYITMWIDLNNNFTFEDDEKFIDAMQVPIEGVETTTMVLIPAGIELGSYRMRVRTTWADDSPLDACADQDWGETEDYTVQIDEGANVSELDPFTFFVSQSIGGNEAYINLNGAQNDYEVMLLDASGRKVRYKSFTSSSELHKETIDTRYLVGGVYVVMVRSDQFRTAEKIIIQR